MSLCGVVSALLCCLGQAAADDDVPPLPSPAVIDVRVAAAMSEVGAQGLAVALIDGGEVTQLRAYGRRNAAGEPLRTDTVMVAASLSKPVFAHLVMQLVDAGRLDLDTPISHYLPQPLPSYPAQKPYPAWSDLAGDERWRAITPRHLLSHRSGLPNIPALEPGEKMRLHFEPGARYAYSGAGINLLQFVLEKGLGLDVEAEMQARIFKRFDMPSSGFTWRAAHASNQADGHTSSGEVRAHPQRQRMAAASSLDTTIEDYARFVSGWVHGEGLSPAAHRALTTPQAPIITARQFPTMQRELPAERRNTGLASGLGVVLFDGPQGPGFFKGGHEDFAGNLWVCLLRRARCVVLMSNDVRAEKAFPGIAAALLGETGMPWGWEYGR